jgi:hypothetical protein
MRFFGCGAKDVDRKLADFIALSNKNLATTQLE